MNHEQQELVSDLCSEKISKEKFLELFFVGGDFPQDYVCQELEAALAIKDADSVEFVLIVGFVFGFTTECSEVLNRLLVEDWHIRHEDIASQLQSFKCPSSVEYLFKAALTDHPYTGSKYALGVKCIHALHDIGTDSAKEKLRILARTENPVLAERAGRLLASMK